MTSSFGISPQRQLRDYTVQPQKPTDLPRPAEPVSEPQRLGGQLMDARSFQQDTRTAQTLKSIEQFLGDQGVFAKESAAYFERYKEEKKQEAFNLYKQEAAAYQQSIENAKDVKALEKMSEDHPKLRIYNLGTGKGTSVKELIGIFEKVNNVIIDHKYVARREGDLAIVYANIEKANKELDWQCIYTVEDMCKHGYNYALANF